MAAKYHTQLMTNGLDMKGVEVVLLWVADQYEAPRALFHPALYELFVLMSRRRRGDR